MKNSNSSVLVGKIRQIGQGMSEYLIIVGLIAVAAIGVVGFMGDTVSSQMAGMAQELAGNSGATARGRADTQAKAAETHISANHNTLKNYDNNAQ